MGGMHGFGPVRTADGELTHHEPWEVRAQALGLVSGTVTRHRLEALGPVRYLESSYYVRWLLAAEDGAVIRGLLERGDLERWYAHFAADPEAAVPVVHAPEVADAIHTGLQQVHRWEAPTSPPRYGVGDRVRVRRMRRERHHRCPRYVRGVVGEIEHVWGADRIPGAGRDDRTLEAVYTVRFSSSDVWGDTGERGEPPFSLSIDLWESYLEDA
jgi:nitrile hydratase